MQKGFKVACMNDIVGVLDTNATQKYKIIQESKVILACLNVAYQSDMTSKLELANNRGFKHPRAVIPIFLEPRNPNFPDNEIAAHCYLGQPDAKVFDISSLLTTADLMSSDAGISPIDIELDNLAEFIRQQIKIVETDEMKHNIIHK